MYGQQRVMRLFLNDELRSAFKKDPNLFSIYIDVALRPLFPNVMDSRLAIKRQFVNKIKDGLNINAEFVEIILWKEDLNRFRRLNSPVTLGDWVDKGQTIIEAQWTYKRPF